MRLITTTLEFNNENKFSTKLYTKIVHMGIVKSLNIVCNWTEFCEILSSVG